MAQSGAATDWDAVASQVSTLQTRIDEMGPVDYGPGEAIGAPDHPHRGFETVTYIIDGAMEHEDSHGHRGALRPGGRVIVYAMNGANPLVGSENIAHNIDHFYNVTEHSLQQILKLAGLTDVKVFALKLYVFWKNPLNYVGLAVTATLEASMRVIFVL